jgi:hypothetical protein
MRVEGFLAAVEPAGLRPNRRYRSGFVDDVEGVRQRIARAILRRYGYLHLPLARRQLLGWEEYLAAFARLQLHRHLLAHRCLAAAGYLCAQAKGDGLCPPVCHLRAVLHGFVLPVSELSLCQPAADASPAASGRSTAASFDAVASRVGSQAHIAPSVSPRALTNRQQRSPSGVTMRLPGCVSADAHRAVAHHTA